MAAVGLKGRATAHPRLCALWMNAKGGSEGGRKPTKIRSMSHGAAVCWTCWPGVVIEATQGLAHDYFIALSRLSSSSWEFSLMRESLLSHFRISLLCVPVCLLT